MHMLQIMMQKSSIIKKVHTQLLKNKFYCIPHYLDIFIIVYSYPINKTSHKYCKHKENINKDAWLHPVDISTMSNHVKF